MLMMSMVMSFIMVIQNIVRLGAMLDLVHVVVVDVNDILVDVHIGVPVVYFCAYHEGYDRLVDNKNFRFLLQFRAEIK